MKSIELSSSSSALMSPSETPFLLITGGKGGVGKSTLTADLGVRLAAQGQRVLLVDLDLGLANLDVILRLGTARTVEDALAGRCSWSDCVVRGPSNVHVLPASSGNTDMGKPDAERRAALLAGMRELGRDYDLVIGDSAAGIGHDVLGFAASADHVFVVTTPSSAALTDAYGLIKALDTWGQDSESEVPTPEIVVNRVSGLEEADSIAQRLQRVCERFLCRKPRRAGWMPFSNSTSGEHGGGHFESKKTPNSLYSKCLTNLCDRVSRLLCVATVTPGA